MKKFIALFGSALLLLTCRARAQESDYIVADAVGKNDAFYQAAERLAAHRRGKIVSLDIDNLSAFRDACSRTSAPWCPKG